MATTISTQDIVNAKRDIDDIGKAVNQKEVVHPRYGDSFKSLPMIIDEFQISSDAAESAAVSAAESAGIAQSSSQIAQDSAALAELSATAATIGGKVYDTPESGVDPVTGVADGAYFNVRSSSDESYIDEYQNVGGSALATGKRYLSSLGVQLQEKAASTIKDASGKNQQEINDLTAEFKATTSTKLNLANFLSKADFQKLKNLDRSLDISDYLNSILTEYSNKRTDADDTYSNAQGILKINLPKGVYEISKPIVGNGVYGLILEGDGISTTSILYKKDTGDVFSFTPYLNVTFKNMSIIHQPISPVKSTWTNSLFKLNGFGGGRRFKTDHVLVVGFNKVFDFVSQGNANEDTTHCMDSQFMHCNTFIYSRSSQAVNNSFGRCSWYGDIKKVFDVSNYGHTHIYDSGVVIAGAFFSLASHPGFYGKTAQFLMTNVKFEWLKSDLTNTNATTKIIETADDLTISAYFKLTNCGIAGGSPDPSINSFDIRGGDMILDVDGGEWVNAKIATKAVTAGSIKDLGWIKFKACAEAPSTAVNRIAGASGAVHRPVIFEDCTGTDNITLLGDSTAGNGAAVGCTTKNVNNLTGNSGRLCLGGVVSTHSSSCYGQQVYVDKIQLFIKSSAGIVNGKARLYFDSAKTVLIKEIPITAQAAPQVIIFTKNGFTSDGIYVEVSQENVNSAIPGYVVTETISI